MEPYFGLKAHGTDVKTEVIAARLPFALTAVFLERLIFLALTGFNVREAIVNSIPTNIERAISVGIGLFIVFVGMQNAGMVVNNDATLVSLGNFGTPGGVLVAVLGLALTGVLVTLRVKGALPPPRR